MTNNIGQILITKKIITESQLDAALERKKIEPQKYLVQILCEMGIPQSKLISTLYYSNKRKPVGQILVDTNIISAEQLHKVLLEQKKLRNNRIRKPLATLLVDMRLINEDSYVNTLSVHFSMPVVSLKNYKVAGTLQKAIGEQYALRHRIVVLEDTPQRVVVALAEPHLFVFEELERGLPSGKLILFCIARSSEIENCLDSKYDPFSRSRY
jgi:hypothetical protein